ncbi:MAG: hypothetical protein KJO28_03840 [Desulfofustis sp.]|nr:hypothetical protein [Desulfofustis sp.]NNF45456.1 hypothetical protein [Desulfofustis sp.]
MKKSEHRRREQKLQLDTEELRAKQSVRTTFKLPEKIINLLKISAKHLSIKQKTLLDQLLEDDKALELLAEEALSHSRNENHCRPKTFVLSQKALDQIEEVSNTYEIPRDFLVELSVSRLSTYIDSLAQTHEKRRNFFKDLDLCREQLDNLLGNAGAELKEDDVFLIKVENLATRTRKLVSEIRKTIKDEEEFIY